MHYKKQAQIKREVRIKIQAQNKAKIRALLFDKAPIEILGKYFNYNNIFLAKNIIELSENFRMNKYTIKLKEYK